MKQLSLAVAVLAGTLFSSVSAAPLETLDQRLSYILGQNVAEQLDEIGINFDVEAFKLAIEEAGQPADKRSLSQEDMMKAVTEARQKAAEKQKQAMAAAAEKNTAEGKAYLAENGKKEGVVTTASGLQYKEVTAGSGETPKESDQVKVHYKGTLLDGTVFDSSYDRGQPATFPVTGVIKGWVEALQLMNVGDKFELAIPSELAYGERGTGKDIGPNATLLFEVELLEIVK